MRRTLWVCLWLDSGPPPPDQHFPVPSSPRPSLQPPQRTWQPNGGRRSWENSRAGASLAEGVLCPTFPTFHRNPPRKGSNRRAMSEVPESSVGAGRRERKEIGTLSGSSSASCSSPANLLFRHAPPQDPSPLYAPRFGGGTLFPPTPGLFRSAQPLSGLPPPALDPRLSRIRSACGTLGEGQDGSGTGW